MFFIEVLMISLYMYSDVLAFVFSTCVFGTIFFQKKQNIETKIIKSLILSTPLFSVSIVGSSLPHIFSWTNIFLLVYIIMLLFALKKDKYRLSKIFIFIILLVLLMLMQCFINNNILSNFTEFIQVVIMIIPIAMTYHAENYLKNIFSQDFKEKIKKNIEITILSLATCVIIQYTLYNFFNITIGNINFHSQRIICDTIFTGYSILSIFLGIGIVLYVYEFIVLKKKLHLIKILILLLGILLNSSRTGLVSSAITAIIIIVRNSVKNKKFNLKNISFLFIFFILALTAMYVLFVSRGDTSLFASSGRNETYQYAWNIITSDIKIFLLGNGLSFNDYGYTIPHNFIIQTLLTNGIFVLMIVLYLMYKLLNKMKNNSFKYMLLCIIIGALFTTDIYANTFFTTFSITGLIFNQISKNKKQ